MKHYETIFIVNPNLGDEEYGEALSKFRDLLDKSNGVIVKVDEWGKQKLAYGLKKFDSGFYVLVDYCGDPGLIVELERNLKLDERILKYQTVKLADKADPEALIREAKETSDERPVKADKAAPSMGGAASAQASRPAEAGRPTEASEASNEADEPTKAAEASAGADEKTAKADEPAEEGEASTEADEKPEKADETSAKAR
jgi:small subunit ribosomal protein S6